MDSWNITLGPIPLTRFTFDSPNESGPKNPRPNPENPPESLHVLPHHGREALPGHAILQALVHLHLAGEDGLPEVRRVPHRVIELLVVLALSEKKMRLQRAK